MRRRPARGTRAWLGTSSGSSSSPPARPATIRHAACRAQVVGAAWAPWWGETPVMRRRDRRSRRRTVVRGLIGLGSLLVAAAVVGMTPLREPAVQLILLGPDSLVPAST